MWTQRGGFKTDGFAKAERQFECVFDKFCGASKMQAPKLQYISICSEKNLKATINFGTLSMPMTLLLRLKYTVFNI